MGQCLRSRISTTSWLLAVALASLACALPVNAATLPAGYAFAPDRLLDRPLLETSLVSAIEFQSFGTELTLLAAAPEDGLSFPAVPLKASTLNSLADRQDTRSENGAEGLRSFLLVTILVGAAVRFLTSRTFYGWAADVFGPNGGYS